MTFSHRIRIFRMDPLKNQAHICFGRSIELKNAIGFF